MKRRLIISIVTSLLLYMIMVAYSLYISDQLNTSMIQLESYVEGTQQIRNSSILVRRIDADVQSFLLSGNDQILMNLKNDSKELDKNINFVSQHTASIPAQNQRIDEFSRLKQRRRALYIQAIDDFRERKLTTELILQYRKIQLDVTEDMLYVLREIDKEELSLLGLEKQQLKRLRLINYVLDVATGLVPLIISFITVFSLVRVINERRKIMEDLKELNTNKDKFISIIGHDLKGPAGAIKLIADVLVQNSGTMAIEQKEKLYLRLQKATENHLNLLQDLLTWSRTQLDKLKLDPVEINLTQMTEEILTSLSEIAVNKGISLQNLVTDDTKVVADENMIRTVIRNIVQNALKFTSRGGEIKVYTENVNDTVSLKISDTGIGMRQSEIDRLFRIETGRSKKGTMGETGSGMGLIISKEFIKKNKGELKIESEPGKGSVFTIILPAVKNFVEE